MKMESTRLLESIISAFSAQVDTQLSSSSLSDDQRQALRARHVQTFTDNLKFGIMKSFGSTDTIAESVGTDENADDVTPDDLDRLQDAMIETTYKRARAPAKAAKLHRAMYAEQIRLLQTKPVTLASLAVTESDSDDCESGHQAMEDAGESCQLAAQTLRDCVQLQVELVSRADQIETAYTILENNRR